MREARVTDAGLRHLAGLDAIDDLTLERVGVAGPGLAYLRGLRALLHCLARSRRPSRPVDPDQEHRRMIPRKQPDEERTHAPPWSPETETREEMKALLLLRRPLTSPEVALFRLLYEDSIYDAYVDDVERTLLKWGARGEDVTDLTQETFMRAWYSVVSEGPPDCLLAKLRGLAMGVALNLGTREKRSPVTDRGPVSSSSEPAAESVGQLEAEGDLQGLRMLEVSEDDVQAHGTHAMRLSTAPWNRSPENKYRGIGSLLVGTAILRSLDDGHKGCAHCESLPKAEAFHEQNGMVVFNGISDEGLRRYRFTEEKARLFVGRLREEGLLHG